MARDASSCILRETSMEINSTLLCWGRTPVWLKLKWQRLRLMLTISTRFTLMFSLPSPDYLSSPTFVPKTNTTPCPLLAIKLQLNSCLQTPSDLILISYMRTSVTLLCSRFPSKRRRISHRRRRLWLKIAKNFLLKLTSVRTSSFNLKRKSTWSDYSTGKNLN